MINLDVPLRIFRYILAFHGLVAPIDDSDRNQNTVLGFPGKSYIRFICLFVSKCFQFYFYSGHTDRQTLSFIYIDFKRGM